MSTTLEKPVAVSVSGLRKSYGDVEAVRGIDLEVPEGELFGFLGPNGAGKSTTIRILCTLTSATAGEVRVAGFDAARQRAEVRRRIGLVFQEPTLDEYLTADQNLRFHAEIYGMARAQVKPRIDTVLDIVGLGDRRSDPVRSYSGGMKRRLEIARGLMHSPRVLFLDEPTIGLDPESRSTLWRYVDELRRREQITVFLTTHYMDEAERCDRIAIINKGTIVALDTPSALKGSVGHDTVRVQTFEDPEPLVAALAEDAVEVSVVGDAVVVRIPDGESFVPRLFELGHRIRSVSVSRPSLDDVFMTYAGTSFESAAAPVGPRGRIMFR